MEWHCSLEQLAGRDMTADLRMSFLSWASVMGTSAAKLLVPYTGNVFDCSYLGSTFTALCVQILHDWHLPFISIFSFNIHLTKAIINKNVLIHSVKMTTQVEDENRNIYILSKNDGSSWDVRDHAFNTTWCFYTFHGFKKVENTQKGLCS